MPSLARQRRLPATLIAALTVAATAVHGYHPDSEDGGLYLAGIKKLLHPELYPHWTAFVTEHLRFSLFAPGVAALVRLSHVPLEWVMLALYCAGIAATLAGGWALLRTAGASTRAAYGGVLLLACWLTLPIAGTSLYLMDPYVTARTFSTPLALFALAAALRAAFDQQWKAWTVSLLCIAMAALLHPLMAVYALAAVIVLAAVTTGTRRQQLLRVLVLAAVAMTAAGLVQMLAPAESAGYARIAYTRFYWFPLRWQWYEQVGALAPLAVLLWLLRSATNDANRTLARTGVALGAIAIAVALLFCEAAYATHLVARMQPLRCLQTVYLLMILLLGARLANGWLGRKPALWVPAVMTLAAIMFFVQRSIYPASAPLELPGRASVNPWQQAFVWARQNTPCDALFALDPHYITRNGEDAQTFRSIAERSTLADYSKDGGEASITPSLTPLWVQAQAAQANLNAEPDPERLAHLDPLGVTWVVLDTSSRTAWECVYRNNVVKICRLPRKDEAARTADSLRH